MIKYLLLSIPSGNSSRVLSTNMLEALTARWPVSRARSSRRFANNANFEYITDAISKFVHITHECVDSKKLSM